MRYSTDAFASTVTAVGGEVIEREHGLTMFTIDERRAAATLRALGERGYHIKAGWPKGLTSEPRGYASASAHVRR